MEKLILIDGSALFYRSYFAMIKTPLINSKGENTSAIFGFTRSLLQLIDSKEFNYLCVVFDSPTPTFRHKIYDQYKATRQKMPEDMQTQIPKIFEIINAFNIPLIIKEGYEADDIIGTIANKFSEKGFEVFLFGVDKDFNQLLSENVKIYNYKTKEIYTKENFIEEYGFEPKKFIEVLALMGDTSDNIPGIPSIGEKRAISLIKQFDSIDNIYLHLDAIKQENIRRNLLENKKNLDLSLKLVKIDTNVPFEIDIESMKIKEPNKESLINLFEELEFQSLLKQISVSKEIEKKSEILNITHKILIDKKDIENELEKCRLNKFIVIDTETDNSNPIIANIIGLSFTSNENESFYVPFNHKEENIKNVKLEEVKEIFSNILGDEEIKKIGHNIKYDKIILEKYFTEIKNIHFDTMIASYLIDPDINQHNLDYLSKKYLNYETIKYKDLMASGKDLLTMDQVSAEYVKDYACEDVDTAYRCMNILEKKLRNNNLEKLFYELEMPLINVLAEMEKNGVKIDVEKMKKLSIETKKELQLLTKKIFDIVGEEFNIRSTKQLQYILFDKLKLPVNKKTKTGFSTDESVLQSLAEIHEVPKLLLEYRELDKLINTYIDALPSMIYEKTGRIHSSFNQTVAATGRLSSSNPNLQNIPVRSELGKKIRECFIPEEGNKIVSADYSQIELRIMAHYSEDDNMINAFMNNLDIHTATAMLLYNKKFEEVDANDRRNAKIVNFGVLYGMGAFKFSQDLNISKKAAQEFIDHYFNQFPKIKKFLNNTINFAEKNEYVETLFGRKRWIKDINSVNKNIKKQAERIAMNTPIQGSAADIIKKAMIDIYKEIKENNYPIKLIMQIHDELVFEMPENDCEKYVKLIKNKMENVIKLKVPLIAEIGIGDNWLEAH